MLSKNNDRYRLDTVSTLVTVRVVESHFLLAAFTNLHVRVSLFIYFYFVVFILLAFRAFYLFLCIYWWLVCSCDQVIFISGLKGVSQSVVRFDFVWS